MIFVIHKTETKTKKNDGKKKRNILITGFYIDIFPIKIETGEEYYLELINKIISFGTVDGLFSPDEQREIVEACQAKATEDGQGHST